MLLVNEGITYFLRAEGGTVEIRRFEGFVKIVGRDAVRRPSLGVAR